MSVLSDATRAQVEQQLVTDGLLTQDKLTELKNKALQTKTPFFALLVQENTISNEQLTRAIAIVTRIPYVNLQGARINDDVLALLPKEIAERYMAVPLGEMQHRLVVAMLDADNIQARHTPRCHSVATANIQHAVRFAMNIN